MKKFFLVLFLSFSLILTFSETIMLRNGDVFTANFTKFENGKFFFDNGKSYSINQIRNIIFANIGNSNNKQNIVKAKIFSKKEFTSYSKFFKIAQNILKNYPDAKYIQLLDIGVSHLTKDDKRIYTYHFIAYVNSYNGVKELSSKSMYYGDANYKSEMLLGRVIYPDGHYYEIDPNNFRVIKPSSEDWSYGGGKVKVYTFPNVKKGVLVEYKVKYINLKPNNPNIYEVGYTFQGDIPVYKSTYKVILPKNLYFQHKLIRKNLKLNYITMNMPKGTAKPIIHKTYKGISYFWKVMNVPPFIKEPYEVNEEDLVPRVEGTILQSRKELDDWVAKMEKERMKVTPYVKQVLKEILSAPDPKNTNLSRTEINLAKIYHWIQKNINYLSVKGSVSSGLTGHPAEETLKNRKGDCIDKSIVFATLVKALNDPNLQVYPVTVKSNDAENMIIQIPVIDGNHAISEVHLKDPKTGKERIFYLDATASSYRYPFFRGDDKGIPAVNEILGTIRQIPVPAPEKEMNFYTINLTIDKKGVITGTTKGKYNGDYEARLRALYMYRKGQKEREKIFQNMVNGMSPKGILLNYKLSDVFNFFEPFTLEYSYKLYDYPTLTKKYLITTIPGVDYYFPEYQLPKRHTPIEYNTSRYTGHKVVITIPKGYKVEYLPPKINLKSDEVSYHAEYTYKNGKIYFEDSYKRYKRIIPVNSYEKDLQIHNAILDYVKKPIVLIKK